MGPLGNQGKCHMLFSVPKALERNTLNPVFCKGEAAFSHLSGEGGLESQRF